MKYSSLLFKKIKAPLVNLVWNKLLVMLYKNEERTTYCFVYIGSDGKAPLIKWTANAVTQTKNNDEQQGNQRRENSQFLV